MNDASPSVAYSGVSVVAHLAKTDVSSVWPSDQRWKHLLSASAEEHH